MSKSSVILGIISSLITILNFVISIPYLFENIDSTIILEITKNNFTLKFGFVLILEFGIGYIFATLLSKSQRSHDLFSAHSSGMIIILLSSWITFFNITEILYYGIETKNYLGLFGFILLSIGLQGSLILFAQTGIYEKWKFERISWVILLFLFEIIFFVVYYYDTNVS